MSNFVRKNLFQIYFRMSEQEVIEYYQELRKQMYYEDNPIKGIEIRKKIYAIIKAILLIDERTSGRRVTIMGDERNHIYSYKEGTEEVRKPRRIGGKIPKDKTRIYTCAHIGRYDIESAIRGVGENCFFIQSDPGETYQNIDGLLLRINGVSWFEMGKPFDAHTVMARQLKVLRQGGNELNFGEAGYCLDPVQPVGKIHPGVAKRGILTDSRIIPVSMEQYEENGIKDYILNIGRSIDLTGTDVSEAKAVAVFIQEEMIKLKREIWAAYGGGKPTEEEFLANLDVELEKYKQRIDFMYRDVPDYYTVKETINEVYEPSELTVKALKKIGYIKDSDILKKTD